MSIALEELQNEAEEAFKRGDWWNALAGFGAIATVDPDHFVSRLRIADCTLNLGKRDEALELYKVLAWHAIKIGYPLLGLIAVKMALLLAPNTEDILLILSELYSRDSDRVDNRWGGPAYPSLANLERDPLQGTEEEVFSQAMRGALRIEEKNDFPDRLPAIPLFSELDEDAFVHILDKIKLRRYADDEVIIREGEHGDSFYIIADGHVLVKKDIEEDEPSTLAHLTTGAVFGEMSLISDEPRAASVVALGNVDVLEVYRGDLIVAAAQMRSVTDALKKFTRDRFLGNLTATHPLFSPLKKEDRQVVIDRVVPLTFAAGEELIIEGQAASGLFLILSGEAEVSKSTDFERVHLATLKAADICGEMSMLGDVPTSATVTAKEQVEVLFLSREGFQEVVQEFPELMRYLAGLTEERVRKNRAMLGEKGVFEDDNRVMI
jgi:cAMP-dependent protein kinase regulator